MSSDKLVRSLAPPIPLEVMPFGIAATLRRLSALGELQRRDGDVTPDGNVLVDYKGPVDDPAALSDELDSTPGVVGHGLFAPSLVSEVLVGGADGSVGHLTAASTA